MARRRWLVRGRRAPLTPSLRAFLETGDFRRLEEVDGLDVYAHALMRSEADLAHLRGLWDEHREEILADWKGRRERPWAETRLKGRVTT